MKRRPARAKIVAELLETLMAILHSLNHRWRSLIYAVGRGYDCRTALFA